MAGENKAFPGLTEVLPGLKEQIKSSLLYKIGNLTNIFGKYLFQTRWLLLENKGKTKPETEK